MKHPKIWLVKIIMQCIRSIPDILTPHAHERRTLNIEASKKNCISNQKLFPIHWKAFHYVMQNVKPCAVFGVWSLAKNRITKKDDKKKTVATKWSWIMNIHSKWLLQPSNLEFNVYTIQYSLPSIFLPFAVVLKIYIFNTLHYLLGTWDWWQNGKRKKNPPFYQNNNLAMFALH